GGVMANAPLPTPLPVETLPIVIGGRTWQITAVHDQVALLAVADQLEHGPYGFLLWDSALALAEQLVAQAEQVRGKRILELGAGVGLPGLVAHSLGASVWQTDHQSSALNLAMLNAQQNGVAGIAHFVADWRTWTHTQSYDLLLGADILYERTLYVDLAHIFSHNLAPGGRLLLSDPGRPQALDFAAQLEKQGWRIELTTQTVQWAPPSRTAKPVEVTLLSGTRPALAK
ncbi:MAG: 50S ribosomal protein L11 methyltransferase, partial [Chloroflexi bacterium]|nr:50S ribosomal protein L11 methyltransferase [Chloroflexota bacterium]